MKKIPFSSENFSAISKCLHADDVVIVPTDTIPGFSSLATKQGVEKIQQLKKRPATNPFVLLVPDFLAAEKLCEFSDAARKLVNQFWPGPLTLVLPRKKGVLADYFPEQTHLALRIPGNETLRKFLHFLGAPLVSTSVNISGNPPLVSAEEIEKVFGEKNILLSSPSGEARGIRDSEGRAAWAGEREGVVSQPSTIIQVDGEKVSILRQGSIEIY